MTTDELTINELCMLCLAKDDFELRTDEQISEAVHRMLEALGRSTTFLQWRIGARGWYLKEVSRAIGAMCMLDLARYDYRVVLFEQGRRLCANIFREHLEDPGARPDIETAASVIDFDVDDFCSRYD